MSTVALPKFYKTAIHFVLSMTIATQSLYMFQPSRAEAMDRKKVILTSCMLALTGAAGFTAGANYVNTHITAPIVTSTTITRDAKDILTVARATPVHVYLGKSAQPDANQISRFRTSFNELTAANLKINPSLLPSQELFLNWFGKNQAQILKDRPLDNNFTMQDLFHSSAVLYVAEVTDVAHNPQTMTTWVEKVKSMDTVTEKELAWWLVGLLSIADFVKSNMKTILVMGILVGGFVAYIEKPNNTLQQWLRMKGVNHLGWLYQLMQRKMFKASRPAELKNSKSKEPEVVQTADEIIAAERQKVSETQSSVTALRKHLYSMGMRANQLQAFEYQENMKDLYIAYGTVWGQFLGDGLRDGRALKWDGMYFRPRDFASNIRSGLSRSNQYTNTFDGIVRDVISEHPEKAQEIRQITRTIHAISKEHVANQIRNTKLAVEKLAELDAIKARLIGMGVYEEQAQRLIDDSISALVERRAATFNLLNFIRHDIEYREFRERIPKEAYQELLRNRHGFGIDAAFKTLRNDILEIADELAVQLNVYDEHLLLLAGLSRQEKEKKVKELGPEQLKMSELDPVLPSDAAALSGGQKKGLLNYLRNLGRKITRATPSTPPDAAAVVISSSSTPVAQSPKPAPSPIDPKPATIVPGTPEPATSIPAPSTPPNVSPDSTHK